MFGVFACDTPTGPYEGKSGREYRDPARQAACDEAMSRMTDPASHNIGDPLHAKMIGLKMWNDWQCGELGKVVS